MTDTPPTRASGPLCRRALVLATACALAVAPRAATALQAPEPAAAACVATARDTAVVAFARGVAAARARLADDAGRLWGRPLDGEWLGLRGRGADACLYSSAASGAAGYTRVELRDGAATHVVWAGPLPPGLNPANTAMHWAGRRWAGIVLPTDGEPASRVRLLVHESMHAHQPNRADSLPGWMPLPLTGEGGEGSDQLEGADGRTWLRLELRALERALRDRGAGGRAAATDALRFRAARYASTGARERQRQRGLDVTEGLPEYTAWMLTRSASSLDATFADRVARAEREAGDSGTTATLVRAFPYVTGPAYALLLDRHAAGWRERVLADGAAADLQVMLLAALGPMPDWAPVLAHGLPGATLPAPMVATLVGGAERAARPYDGASLRVWELARWERVEAPRRALRARFVDGPTLRIRPPSLQVVFDPNGQTSLGADGTVMRGFVWTTAAGAELRAPEGALVSADWSELRVPLEAADAAALAPSERLGAVTLRGAHGWTLVLPAGWRLARDGTSWVLQPSPP